MTYLTHMRLMGKVVSILVAGQNQNSLLFLIMPLIEDEPEMSKKIRMSVDNALEVIHSFLSLDPCSTFLVIKQQLKIITIVKLLEKFMKVKIKRIDKINLILVEHKGFEPLASSMPWKRASQLRQCPNDE